jgi:hypothetical protein
LFAYARGNRSSRAIERECGENIAYRILAANLAPDHSTIAEFRCRHDTALAGLFSNVLSLCREAGLVKVGVIAIDGTKVHANASNHANRDDEQIAKEILEEAAAVDAAEDELYGDKRGDELPEQLTSEHGRRAWFREAKHRLDAQREQEARPIPQSRPKRLKESKRRLEEELWFESRANTAYEAWRARGVMSNGRKMSASPKPYVAPQTPAGKTNVTDPDSRNLKAFRGYLQGYNAQAVVTEDQIVVAAEVNADSPDFGHLEPMLTAAQSELHAAGVAESPEIVVADTGYWHQVQMEAVVDRGIQVIIPPDASKRTDTRPGWDGGLYAFMRRVIASDAGGALYRRPQGMIEPVFAQVKFNRKIERFQRRGRSAVRSEWRLIAATHNLLKLHNHQIATATA